MAERRRNKKKREIDEIVEDDKSQKIEFEVAKYLRSKLPSKRTTLLGHKVDYFIASKAIDCLLDSKWARTDKKDEDAMFTSRDSVVGYMQRMLVHQFFHRAKPIIVSKKETRKRGDDPPESSAAEDTREKKKDKVKKEKKEKSDKDGEKDKDKSKEIGTKGEKEDEPKDTDKEIKEEKDEKEPKESKDKKEGKDGERKKEKKKVKLDMHLEQIFVDGNHPYVWIYDPIPVKTWFIGALFVIAAIAICLFPLWPKTVRNLVYYLSLAGAGFLLFVFSLVILRFVIFVIIWVFTFGKHNFWILPNLTEDVGVLESFWPLYQYEYKGSKKSDESSKEEEGGDKKEKSKEKKEKKQKIDDAQTGDGSVGEDKKSSRKGSKTTEDEDEEDQEEDPEEDREEDQDDQDDEEEERSDKVSEEDGEDGEDAPLMEDDNRKSSKKVKIDNGFEILDVHESS